MCIFALKNSRHDTPACFFISAKMIAKGKNNVLSLHKYFSQIFFHGIWRSVLEVSNLYVNIVTESVNKRTIQGERK